MDEEVRERYERMRERQKRVREEISRKERRREQEAIFRRLQDRGGDDHENH